MRVECRDLLEQIAEQTLRINARTAKIKVLAAEADTARRLQTIPGVGPFTALAVEAFAPPMESFSCGRDLDRKRVVKGKSLLVSVDIGGGRYIKIKRNRT